MDDHMTYFQWRGGGRSDGWTSHWFALRPKNSLVIQSWDLLFLPTCVCVTAHMPKCVFMYALRSLCWAAVLCFTLQGARAQKHASFYRTCTHVHAPQCLHTQVRRPFPASTLAHIHWCACIHVCMNDSQGHGRQFWGRGDGGHWEFLRRSGFTGFVCAEPCLPAERQSGRPGLTRLGSPRPCSSFHSRDAAPLCSPRHVQ